jgi:hypothetical protein
LEKSDKFSKIPCLLDILEYNFRLTHLYSNIWSFFTSGKNDLVKFMLKISCHLGVLGTLTQLHHWSKLDKGYSKLNYRCFSLIRLICIYHLPISKKICNFQKWSSLSQIQLNFSQSRNWSMRLGLHTWNNYFPSCRIFEYLHAWRSYYRKYFLFWECDLVPFHIIMKNCRLSLIVHTVSNLKILKFNFDFWTLTTYLAS